jgi:hypothetical protein|tara:strand:- start:397 stop:714 length:318 start_codon:yes stop_codon:yes gene_type:complete
MHNRFLLSFLAIACFAFVGCETNDTASTSSEWHSFEGEVVWVKTSRGFWAIQTKKSGKINPLKLPEAFKVNGLKICGEVRLFPKAESARNWGTVGEVRAVERLSE